MKLYLVARWGNDQEGPNGKDTIFLVSARSHLLAAQFVDKALSCLPHAKVSKMANWICFLGYAPREVRRRGILIGPYYEISGLSGFGDIWTREVWQKKWKRIALNNSGRERAVKNRNS